MLEDARPRRHRRERAVRGHALVRHFDQLAGLDRTQIGRADHVERHRLRGKNIGLAEPAHDQWPDAERIAAGDHALGGEADQAVGALDLLQCVDEAVEQGAISGRRDEMDDNLGVAGRLEDRAAPVELALEPHRVRNIAVVRDREAARGELGEQGLDVAERGLAGGRVADMADRGAPGERADHLVLVEIAGDMAHRAMAVEIAAVIAGDPGRFLAAMLERMQAQSGHRRGAVGAPQAEDAAFLAELVAVEGVSGQHVGLTAHISRPAGFVAPQNRSIHENLEGLRFTLT